MRTRTLAALTLAIAGSLASPAYAVVSTGKPTQLFADPDDVVVFLDTQGVRTKCGSQFFHIQRTNTNFKELTAVALTAYAAGKKLIFFVESCMEAPATDRNIVDHGAVTD